MQQMPIYRESTGLLACKISIASNSGDRDVKCLLRIGTLLFSLVSRRRAQLKSNALIRSTARYLQVEL